MGSRISVLIADDDCGHRETLVEVVRARGMEAHAAETGVRAIAIAKSTVIHAGILDVHMPGLTGIETCRRLHRVVGRLPLILMSGAASEGLRLDALSAGAASFLPKPLDLGILLRTLEELLRDRRFRDEREY